MKLLKPIADYIETLDTANLSEDRKSILQPLIDYINTKTENKQHIQLNFICTHNSRRSPLAQLWAQVMAVRFKVPNVKCFSGGTLATAVYPIVVQTLEDTGFQIFKETTSEKPIYQITYAPEMASLTAFSKKYDDDPNPKSNFAAVMTCSQADAGCPFVAGSEKRISIMYKDPKISDGTPLQKKTYWERSNQIATEMKYVFSKINL